VILEIALPAPIIMDSMDTKLAAMIEYQLFHRTKPPILLHQLIDYQLVVLGIDG